ncbi:MAG: GNAT family N-acetyltransferase [Rubellimicrobium sp.]|nr:GNAT family N-acetyltransferase [Rubellimicrobium sp.]
MTADPPRYEVRLARDAEDLRAALALRYEVFADELGVHGASVDHARRLESDSFDPLCEHLLLVDHAGPGVVGTTRIIDSACAARAGGFYCASEFDLAPLLASGRALMEMGRTCLHPGHRGGAAMYHLWHGLARIVTARGVAVLFGAASLPGVDVAALAQPLSWLHTHHLAPQALRVRARQVPPVLPPERIDRRAAMLAMPALVKAYLRLGGVVGEGVYVDPDFNTTDVCLILDLDAMTPARRAIYAQGGRA